MATIIDRRLNPSGKNQINRQKFLDRVKDQVKEAVKKSVADNTIKDIGKGEKVRVRSKDVSEPTFHPDHKTGSKKHVLPGNIYEEGDTIEKPSGSGGSGNKAGKGEGLDEFEFSLTREEFLEYLFEDLELPDFVKESMKVTDTVKYSKAGFTKSGSPANLSVLRTFKNSIGRRLALFRPTDEEVAEAEMLWMRGIEEELPTKDLELLYDAWKLLESKQKIVPFIDENDLRYNYYDAKPNPSSQAVMFCLMDVSGSMDERRKDISKRFFLLLYLFLEKKYDKIDIRFVRHTETAEEVDEHTFFYDRKSGGTAISSGLEVITDIINREYSPADWNIYISQCTDGDNDSSDNEVCRQIIEDKLQKIVQYYAYIQVGERPNFGGLLGYAPPSDWSAMPMFRALSKKYQNIDCKIISDQDQIWRVFRSLFSKETT